MPPELHHPIGRRPWRHEVAGVAQFAMGEGASDASKAVASSTYASPWGSLCCWRTAAAPLVWCETSRSPDGWGWRMAFPQLLIGGERGMEQQAHSSLNHHANLFLLFILNLWCTYSTCLFFLQDLCLFGCLGAAA
uniref:Uncharacterized protein n=1 Tax=Triticum urartu TaxID=4572 RepID=A0A8R7VKQ1_TRIUA